MPGIHFTDRDLRVTRRRVVGSALALAGGIALGRPGLAQDDQEVVPIQSTELGPMPSTGTIRDGFVSEQPGETVAPATVRPAALVIEKAQIDAEIEVQEIVDGVMQNPTGPWIVAWYEQTAELGEGGNVVMAGHVDYWNVGPAVFWDVRNLPAGDIIRVVGEDGKNYEYAVQWIERYDTAALTPDVIQNDIVGDTGQESLTLITCGGEFDPATGEYNERWVVRANRV